MTLEEQAKKYSKQLPNSTLIKYYEAAIPLYKANLVLRMEKEKEISLLQEYILKFLNEGISCIDEICEFLGVNYSVISNAVAILQSQELITIDIFNSTIKFTEKGKEALKKAKTIVPENVDYDFLIDGFTSEVLIKNTGLYNNKDLKAFEIFALPYHIAKPQLEDISIGDVKNAIEKAKKAIYSVEKQLDGNLIALDSINKMFSIYKKISVFIYKNKEQEQPEIRVFDSETRCQHYEAILLSMFNKKIRIFELDEKVDSKDFSKYLPMKIQNEAKSYTQKVAVLQNELTQLQTQLIQCEIDLQNEPLSTSEKQHEKAEISKAIQNKEQELSTITRFLAVHEHRPLLLESLENATNQVVIISPWIKVSGLNKEVERLIEKAMKRGVEVVIGYGISKDNKDSDQRIIDNLSKLSKKTYKGSLKIVPLNNTHEKILIKDMDFVVVTSFNWLSFRGNPDWEFRQERGTYTSDREAIIGLKKDLSDNFGFELT